MRGGGGGGRARRRRRRSVEDKVRERFGPAGGLGRSVAREVIERGWEYGADVQLAREVDDVDRSGDLVPWFVLPVRGERHPFAPVPVGKGDWEVALKTL